MTLQLAPIHTRLLKDWTVLAANGAPHSNTGSTTENTVASVTLPGGTLGPNGALRISSLWSAVASAGQKILRIRLGGVAIMQIGPTAQTQLNHILRGMNRNSQSSQVFMPVQFASFGVSAVAILATAVNTAVDQAITFTIQGAVAGDVAALEGYHIETLYGA